MSDEDTTERESSDSPESAPDDRRDEESLATALEDSLRAGLRSVSDGLGNLVEDTSTTGPPSRSPRTRPSAGRNRPNQKRRGDDVKRKRTKRTVKSKSDECLLDTRLTDGEFIVIADLLGASRDDISVGINPRTNELVIRKTSTVVGRVDLPWDSPEMKKAWFKNGILEVYMRSEDSESAEESSP